MRKRTTLALISLALLGTSLAAPKKVTGYGSLGVVDGKPGGTYTLALGDSQRTVQRALGEMAQAGQVRSMRSDPAAS